MAVSIGKKCRLQCTTTTPLDARFHFPTSLLICGGKFVSVVFIGPRSKVQRERESAFRFFLPVFIISSLVICRVLSPHLTRTVQSKSVVNTIGAGGAAVK